MQRNCRVRCNSARFFLECQTCETTFRSKRRGWEMHAKQGNRTCEGGDERDSAGRSIIIIVGSEWWGWIKSESVWKSVLMIGFCKSMIASDLNVKTGCCETMGV